MKKLSILFIALVMLSLIGCDNGTGGDTTNIICNSCNGTIDGTWILNDDNNASYKFNNGNYEFSCLSNKPYSFNPFERYYYLLKGTYTAGDKLTFTPKSFNGLRNAQLYQSAEEYEAGANSWFTSKLEYRTFLETMSYYQENPIMIEAETESIFIPFDVEYTLNCCTLIIVSSNPDNIKKNIYHRFK